MKRAVLAGVLGGVASALTFVYAGQSPLVALPIGVVVALTALLVAARGEAT